MSGLAHEFMAFDSREEATWFATQFIAGGLEKALESKATASLMVSGGSTPGGVFDALTATKLEWSRVVVGLVDERWVNPEDDASNERLVRSHLLKGHAGAAGFLPMKSLDASPEAAVTDREMAYTPHCEPVDVVLLGMGEDGHTASWFPGSSGLAEALESDATVVANDATGCAVAGNYTQRITLTGKAITNAAAAVLLIFGESKKAVFEAALTALVDEKPVKYAIDKLGPRLTVVWAA
jgi:6-phosphogluconolactonase